MQQGQKRPKGDSKKSRVKKGKGEAPPTPVLKKGKQEVLPPPVPQESLDEELQGAGEVPPESPERPPAEEPCMDAAQVHPTPTSTKKPARKLKPEDLEVRKVRRQAEQNKAAKSLEALLKTPDMDDCRPLKAIRVEGLEKLILGSSIMCTHDQQTPHIPLLFRVEV